MYKLSLFMVFAAAAAVANGQISNSSIQYVNTSREAYVELVSDMNNQMKQFEELYEGSLRTVFSIPDMLVGSIDKANKDLNMLAAAGGSVGKCVNKYRHFIASAQNTTSQIKNCTSTDEASFLTRAKNIRDTVKNYYEKRYGNETSKCEKIPPLKITECLIKTVTEADNYVAKLKNDFMAEIEKAKFLRTYTINKLLTCSYATEKEVLSSITKADDFIRRCILGNEDCIQCPENNCPECNKNVACPFVEQISSSQITYENKDIKNPFKVLSSSNCVMLQITQ